MLKLNIVIHFVKFLTNDAAEGHNMILQTLMHDDQMSYKQCSCQEILGQKLGQSIDSSIPVQCTIFSEIIVGGKPKYLVKHEDLRWETR